MMRKFTLSVLTLFVAAIAIAQNENNKLQFSSEGTFKIAQFTDLHWDHNSPKCEQTIQTIESVLAIEKPNLAILTGDVVTAPPAKDGWLSIA